MNHKKSFLFLVIILVGLNAGLFNWNGNLERDLKPKQIHYLDNLNIHTMTFDAEDRLWTISKSGINVFQNNHLVKAYSGSAVEAIKDNLPYGEDVQMYFDRQNNPWLVGKGHIYVLENDKWVEFGSDLIQIKGGVSVISFDLQNRVWVGTYYDNGLFMIDGRSVTQYTTYNSQLTRHRITDIAVDREGKVWVTTSGGGIFIVDGNEWKTLNTANSPLTSDYVYTIAFDAKHQAWIGTSDGLNIFDGQNWIVYAKDNSPLISDIYRINFTKTGQAWLDHYVVLQDGKWKYYFIPTKPFENIWVSKIVDSQGNVFMLSQFAATPTVSFISADVRLCSAFEVFVSFMVVSGGLAFISILLIEIWLASFWKSEKLLWRSLGIAFLVGLFFFWFWTTETRSVILMREETQIFFIGNPGFISAMTVVTSTIIAKSLSPSEKAEAIGVTIGWFIGIPLGIVALAIATLYMMGPM